MGNRVVVIHSTPEGEIGELVLRELKAKGSLNISELATIQKSHNRAFFSIVPDDSEIVGHYRTQRYLVYSLLDNGTFQPNPE